MGLCTIRLLLHAYLIKELPIFNGDIVCLELCIKIYNKYFQNYHHFHKKNGLEILNMHL